MAEVSKTCYISQITHEKQIKFTIDDVEISNERWFNHKGLLIPKFYKAELYKSNGTCSFIIRLNKSIEKPYLVTSEVGYLTDAQIKEIKDFLCQNELNT